MTINWQYLNTLFSGIIFAVLSIVASADDYSSREYKIKAAYLYNLTKFVNWPKNTNDSNSEPDVNQFITSSTLNAATQRAGSVNICIYGHNPFDKQLDKLEERKARGKPIKISIIEPASSIYHCHILFLSNTVPEVKTLLSSFSDAPILTVGEEKGFLNQGGLINMVIEKNRLQLQINLTAAKAHDFEISSNLLEIARVVK